MRIVSNIMSRSGGSEGLAFAVTSNTARRLLLEQKPFWSGIEGLPAEGNFARATNLPQSARVLVPRISSAPDGEVINSHPAVAYRVVTAVGHLPISRHSLSPPTALGIEEATSGYL